MGVQQIIIKIQTWLNETYQGRSGYKTIEITGEASWETTNAMLIAYQIENGVSIDIIDKEIKNKVYNFTSEGFSNLSSNTDFSIQANLNRLYILQGAFYVKGINPYGFQVPYNSAFTSAVNTLQLNAGIAPTGVADILVVKALLSMDAFIVEPQYGGVEEIVQIQRILNAKYAYDMGSLLPCDGVYGRDLNKGLIYDLQITEGISVSSANEADGYFGASTQAKCKTLVFGDSGNFVEILQYALYCNGYTGVSFTGIYDDATESAVASFGRAMQIDTNYGSQADLDVWMGLLLSSGNPNRIVSGCDVSQRLSLEDAQILKENGYDIVGRYLTGNFATSQQELIDISNAGLNIFPIYETASNLLQYFSQPQVQGASDAISAAEACRELGIPQGTRIYFTVDYDMEENQIENLVLPYFEAIYNKFNDAQLQYNIGVYGSRNVCAQVINSGYAQYAFVDGASTGYSGNMGYPMPEMWAFNQIKEQVDINGVEVDNDQVSGREPGFNMLGKSLNNQGPNEITSNNEVTISQPELGDLCDLLTYMLTNNFNMKSLDITKLACKALGKDKDNILEKVGPIPIAKDICYVRFDAGLKYQFGRGSDINMYFDTNEEGNLAFNFDTLVYGAGSNINLQSLMDKDSEMGDKLRSLLPTGAKGQLQFYSCWQGNADAQPGYWEIALEVGINISSINENTKTDDEVEKIKELQSWYVFYDIIIGINEDIIDKGTDGISTKISTDFAWKLLLNTAYPLTIASKNGVNIETGNKGASEVIFNGNIPKIFEILINIGKSIFIGSTVLVSLLTFLDIKIISFKG